MTAQEVSQAKRNFRHLEQLARNLAEAVAAYEKMLEPYLEVPTLVQIASNPVYEEKIAPRTTQCFNHVPVRYEGRFASYQGKTRETWRPLADQNTGLDNPIDPSPEPPKDLQWLGGWLFFMLRSFCGEGSIIDDIWLSIEQPERESLSLQSNPRDNRGDVPEMLLKERWRLDSVTKEALTYLAPSVVQSRVEYRIAPDASGTHGLRLELRQSVLADRLKSAQSKSGQSKDRVLLTVSARLELDTLINSLALPEAFTDLIVADETGQVMLHHPVPTKSASTRFTHLDAILGAEVGRRTMERGAASSGEADDAQRRHLLLTALPLQALVRLGEGEYQVFAQTLLLDARNLASTDSQDKAVPLKLLLVGLVSGTEARWQAMSVPRGIALAIILCALAGTMALPVIKLLTMGPRDWLWRLDAVACLFCAAIGAALITITLAAWNHDADLKKDADAGLEQGAKQIQTAFESDLKQAADDLAVLAGMEPGINLEDLSTCGDTLNSRRWWMSSVPPYQGCRGAQGRPQGMEDGAHALIHNAIWVDRAGDIQRIETIREVPILTPNIGSRSYLRDVWNDTNLISMSLDQPRSGASPCGDPVGRRQFSVEPIFAWDGGEFGSMLAMRVCRLPVSLGARIFLRVSDPKDYVVAIRVPLRSLTDAAVPPGYAYAVIDRDGRVLYHSDGRYNLRENLFRETDEAPDFQSLVKAAHSDTVRVRYHGRPHVFYHVPLLAESGPVLSPGDNGRETSVRWTLVVMRDVQWIDWVTNEALYFGIVLLTIYAVIVGVIGLAAVIAPAMISRRVEWMWPCEAACQEYGRLIKWSLLGLLVLSALVMIHIRCHALFAMCLASVGSVVVTSLVVGRLWLWSRQRREPERAMRLKDQAREHAQDKMREEAGLSDQTRWAYTALATSTILVLTCLPAGTFLAIGFQRATSLYESFAAVDLNKQQQTKQQAYTDRLRRMVPLEQELGKGPWCQIRAWRPVLGACLDVPPGQAYLEFFFGGASSSEPRQGLPNLLAHPKVLEPPANENLTSRLGDWVNRTHREFLHLWTKEAGQILGGRIGLRLTVKENATLSGDGSPAWKSRLGQSGLKGDDADLILALICGLAGITSGLRLGRLQEPFWRDGSQGRGACVKTLLVLAGFFAVSMLGRSWNETPSSPSLGLFDVFGTTLAVTLCTYGYCRVVHRHLFMLDFREPLIMGRERVGPSTPKHVLLVVPPTHGREWLTQHLHKRLDAAGAYSSEQAGNPDGAADDRTWTVWDIPKWMAEEDVPLASRERYLASKNPLALVDIDYRLSERTQRLRMLEIMERLALQPDRPLLILSRRHPFDAEVVPFESSQVPVQDHGDVDDRARWAHALRTFVVIPFSGRVSRGVDTEVVEGLLNSPHFVKIDRWENWLRDVAQDEHSESYTNMRHALGTLRCRYEHWWAECTPSEQLALWHIAHDGFLHSRNSKLYPLVWKGLATRRPNLEIFSKSFRRFVLQVADRDGINQFADDLKPSLWAKLGKPLLLGLASTVIFLGVTQDNIRQVILAFIPVLPAFLVEIPRLFSGGAHGGVPKPE